ncbi:cancer/testis antigen 55-like [Lepus europaeus]|uniref:cancer/testis antigen 55-like n=1 Tax=Lepus europaeus TaxID=9983 RepID=UPI002B46C369|nr:cancer/testis antigen 55-like [Lepus europaeus]
MFRLIAESLVVEASEDAEAQNMHPIRVPEDDTNLPAAHGAIGISWGDFGFTDESVFFITDVSGRVPLSSDQNVAPSLEEDEAAQVNIFCNNCYHNSPAEYYRIFSMHCISSQMGGADCAKHICRFSVDIVSTEFDPYPHDCMQVRFYIQPTMRSRKILSVRPHRHRHVREVRITSVHGRNGVIGNSTFFTLDSLILPDGYVPQIHDVVNAVVVESVHAGYIWRAVSITPVATV